MSDWREKALALATRGWPVLPLCWPTLEGQCACGGGHTGRDVGKAPIGKLAPHGSHSATTDATTIAGWWDEYPEANVGVDLERAGLVFVDPDSPEALAEVGELGLPPTITRHSQHDGYLCARPDDCPVTKTTRQGASSALDVLAKGYAVVYGCHRTGAAVYLDGAPEPAPAPRWAVRLLTRAATQRQPARRSAVLDAPDAAPVRLDGQGVDRWRGELVELTAEGTLDRSKSLFMLGVALAEAGASAATIGAALEARDRALGWDKFCDRKDAEVRYGTIAAKAVEYADGPTLLLHGAAEATTLAQTGAAVEAWPEPPGAAAFSGLAGRVVDAIAPHSESDRVALLMSFLVGFGCVVGPGPHALVAATRHPPRLFAALVGRSAKARKGDSWPPARALLAAIDQLFPKRILGGLASGEGLIQEVRDATPPEADDGGLFQRADADEGVSDKRLLIMEPELARVLRVMGRQGNSLSSVVRDAWDHGPLRVMTRTRPLSATDPHIALLAHITRAELRRELTSTEAVNGFANRIIWMAVRRAQELPEPAPFLVEDHPTLVKDLTAALAEARAVTLMQRDADARNLWAETYHDLSAEREGLSGSILARAETHVLRLSLVYALLDASPRVGVAHLVAAMELWAYAERSVLHIFGDATGDGVADVILKALRASEELTRTQISELFGRNESSARIVSALALLVGLGKAKVTMRSTRGRTAEVWRAVGGQSNGMCAE